MSSVQLLSAEDQALLERIAGGGTVTSIQESSVKYKELAIGLLLQYADSEMAGAAAYAQAQPLAADLDGRIALARISSEKLQLARKTYDLVAQSGMNIDKYIASHCWESRLERNVNLAFRRATADKRVNALMYPWQGWADLLMFTYLMTSMACLQLADFCSSSFEPWAKLALQHLPVEKSQQAFGLCQIEKLLEKQLDKELLRLSRLYWLPKVLCCFGPAASQRNQEYLQFKLKKSRNEELSRRFEEEVGETLARLGI